MVVHFDPIVIEYNDYFESLTINRAAPPLIFLSAPRDLAGMRNKKAACDTRLFLDV
jgi:hypothetical protein